MRIGDAALAADLAERVRAAGGGATTRESYGRTEVVVGAEDWVDAARTARDALGAEVFDHLGVHDAGGPDRHGEAWEVSVHVLSPHRAGTVWLVVVLEIGRAHV